MHITDQWLLHYFAIFYYPSIQNRNTSYLTYASIQVYTTLCSMMTDGRMSVLLLPVDTFIDNCVNVLWEFNFDELRYGRCTLRCTVQWECFSLRCPRCPCENSSFLASKFSCSDVLVLCSRDDVALFHFLLCLLICFESMGPVDLTTQQEQETQFILSDRPSPKFSLVTFLDSLWPSLQDAS